MLAKFLELNSKTLYQSSGKEQGSRLRPRPGQNVKLGTFTGSSRVATAKKCTKKRDARAKIQSNYKPRVRTVLSFSNSMNFSMTFLSFPRS